MTHQIIDTAEITPEEKYFLKRWEQKIWDECVPDLVRLVYKEMIENNEPENIPKLIVKLPFEGINRSFILRGTLESLEKMKKNPNYKLTEEDIDVYVLPELKDGETLKDADDGDWVARYPSIHKFVWHYIDQEPHWDEKREIMQVDKNGEPYFIERTWDDTIKDIEKHRDGWLEPLPDGTGLVTDVLFEGVFVVYDEEGALYRRKQEEELGRISKMVDETHEIIEPLEELFDPVPEEHVIAEYRTALEFYRHHRMNLVDTRPDPDHPPKWLSQREWDDMEIPKPYDYDIAEKVRNDPAIQKENKEWDEEIEKEEGERV